MRKHKKGLSLLIALMMLVSMTMVFTVTASAAGEGAITINQPASDTVNNEGQVFNAYKVFNLTYAGDAFSYTVDPRFRAFFGTSAAGALGFSAGMTDPQIAMKIVDFDAVAMRAFADGLLGYIEANAGITPDGTTTGTRTDPSVISNLDLGYYLVTGSVVTEDGEATVVTACSLDTTAPNALVTPKVDAPTIGKEVYNHNTEDWSDWTDLNIGDTAEFKLTSKVPANLVGYDTYTYTVHDRMSAGLTFNNDVAVTVGGSVYTHFSVQENPTPGANCSNCTLHIIFDSTEILKHLGEDIVITYSAEVNGDAVIGAPGNPNTVWLEFSNNPYDSSARGKTEEDRVVVYTFRIDIFKYTGSLSDGPEALSGAVFELRKTAGGAPIDLVRLTSGNADAPAVYRTTIESDTAGVTQIISPESGKIEIKGLDAGVYYLVETAAPDGYNLLPGPILVTITHNNPGQQRGSFTVSYEAVGEDGEQVTANGTVNVLNLTGTEFPGTGGVGRTIFTLVGSALMVGALAALFLRRRVKSERF